jgi:uncharacterized membrane protein
MTADPTLKKHRIQSIDILRGVIMLIMALDHVRDFFHMGALTYDATNMATTTPILFFTRWITHFCAPTFLFLSGISAYIAGTRRTKKELSLFLIKRGFWLLFVEAALITLALTLNPLYNVFLLQVIWAIGGSMIILGLLIWLPLPSIAAIGIVIFFGHDILDYIKLPETGAGSVVMKILFTAKAALVPLDNKHFLIVLYALLPWTGVMLIGYVFGTIYTPGFDASKRKRILIVSGLSLLVLFLILRTGNIYGDPAPWLVQRNGVFTVLSYFNLSKYPPSLLYLCMTLSPALLILAFTEKTKNKLTDIFAVYGSVPFFYYILHFYLIRVFTVISFYALGYNSSQIISKESGFLFTPKGAGYNLGVVYLIWLALIVILYFPCRWYNKYKKTHHQWWLSYL